MHRPDQPVQYLKYQQGTWQTMDAHVIVESPISLSVNSVYWLSFLCTPTSPDALAVGFLFNEGIIKSLQEVVAVDICDQGSSIDVWIDRYVEKPADWRRTTGCSGGFTSVGQVPHLPYQEKTKTLCPEQIGVLMGLFLEKQDLYRLTRGVHSSALSDGASILLNTEDIGRHNTLDKLAGLMLQTNLAPDQKIILTTGRISSEMLQKSARIGAEIVISRTAANNTSIRLAEESGITLIGYARRNEFNLYAHPERIQTAPIVQTI